MDKSEYGNAWGKARAALAHLFLARAGADNGGGGDDGGTAKREGRMNAAKLRELIVDLRPPRFAGKVGAGADKVGCSGLEEAKAEERSGGGETMNATHCFHNTCPRA